MNAVRSNTESAMAALRSNVESLVAERKAEIESESLNENKKEPFSAEVVTLSGDGGNIGYPVPADDHERQDGAHRKSPTSAVRSKHDVSSVRSKTTPAPSPENTKGTYKIIRKARKCQPIMEEIISSGQAVAVSGSGFHVKGQERLGMLQICTWDHDIYLLDLLDRDNPNDVAAGQKLLLNGGVKDMLESPAVVKVMHACSTLSKVLCDEFGIILEASSVFDTESADQTLQSLDEGRTLASLTQFYGTPGGEHGDHNSGQRSLPSPRKWADGDPQFWKRRPLTPDMIESASAEVSVLVPELYNKLSSEIHEAGLWSKFRQSVQRQINLFRKFPPPDLTKYTQQVIVLANVIEAKRCSTIMQGIMSSGRPVAVSGSGVRLPGQHRLTLLQICTWDKQIYLLDLLSPEAEKLLEKAGVNKLLQSSKVEKVMHSCSYLFRALKSRTGSVLKPASIFDTQLADKFLQMQDDDSAVTPIERDLELLTRLQGTPTHPLIEDHDHWVNKDPNIWTKRPLTPKLIQCACYDVAVLVPQLYSKLKSCIEEKGAMSQYRQYARTEISGYSTTTEEITSDNAAEMSRPTKTGQRDEVKLEPAKGTKNSSRSTDAVKQLRQRPLGQRQVDPPDLNKYTQEVIHTDEVERCSAIMKGIMSSGRPVAVSGTGVSLPGEYRLTLLQICTLDHHIYLLDLVDKKRPGDPECGFKLMEEGGVKQMLESKQPEKVIHACSYLNRNLKSQFAIRLDLASIFDTQAGDQAVTATSTVLMEERSLGLLTSIHKTPSHPLKQARHDLVMKDPRIWAKRPMTSELTQCACYDVAVLIPQLYHTLKSRIEQTSSWQKYQECLKIQVTKKAWVNRQDTVRIFEDMERKYTEDTPLSMLSSDERKVLLLLPEKMSTGQNYPNPIVKALETKVLLEELEDLARRPPGYKAVREQLHHLNAMTNHRNTRVKDLAVALRSKFSGDNAPRTTRPGGSKGPGTKRDPKSSRQK